MKQKILIPVFVFMALFVAGCGGGNNQQTPYHGYQGIEVSILPGSFPSIFYYVPSNDPNYNVLTADIQIKNKGASYSKGGVYLTGYDPNFIQWTVRNSQGEVFGWSGYGSNSPCTINVGNVNLGLPGNLFGLFGGSVDCYGSRYSFDANKFTGGKLPLSISYDRNTGRYNVDIGSSDLGLFGASDYYPGEALIGVMSGPAFDFAKNNGVQFELHGNTPFYPGGEEDYLSAEGHIVSWPPNTGTLRQKFQLTTCYGYSTYLTPMVCIDPVPNSEDKKVCRQGTLGFSGGQGAPVEVTSIEQHGSGRFTTFTIHFRNRGNGDIISIGSLEKCNPWSPYRLTRADLNKVYLGLVLVPGPHVPLKCTPSGFINMENGAGQVTCRYEFTGAVQKSAYQTPLVIELWYGYRQTQTREVEFELAA